MGFPAVAVQLEHQMPQAMATWGLPVIPHELAQWHLSRSTSLETPMPQGMLTNVKVICTDGSGIHPKNPMLRTVAWGMAWHDGSDWHHTAGGVPGMQTVPRSEAAAILAAVQGLQDGCDLWSDCLMVVTAVRAVALHGDLTPELDRSPLVDLLRQMVPHLRRLGPSLEVKYMKSHGSPEQALAHGVPEEALAMREQIKRPRRKRSGWPPQRPYVSNAHTTLPCTCRPAG